MIATEETAPVEPKEKKPRVRVIRGGAEKVGDSKGGLAKFNRNKDKKADAKQEKNGIAQSHMLYHAHDLHMYTEASKAKQEAGEGHSLDVGKGCDID